MEICKTYEITGDVKMELDRAWTNKGHDKSFRGDGNVLYLVVMISLMYKPFKLMVLYTLNKHSSFHTIILQ